MLFIGMPDSYDYIFDGHAGASPSGAERWMHCTASLQASREFLETLTPNQQVEFAKGSTAARQGTTAHAVAEVELKVRLGQMEAAEAETTMLELTALPADGEQYDDEMAEAVQQYVDLVGQYIDDDRRVLVEQRLVAAVPITDCDGHEGDVYEIKGSGDTVVLPEPGIPVLTVIDLKYGEGLYIEAEENLQERIYALGALALLIDDEGNLVHDVERIDYYIVQPRNGGIKHWSESLDDLLDWRDEVLSMALTRALYDPVDLPSSFEPSDETCQWCPAKGSCAALADHMMSRGEELFDAITEAEFENGAGSFPETGSLSDERLGALLAQINGLVKLRDDLKEEAQRRLHRGIEVPGFRLVNYSPPRTWAEGASEELHDMAVLWKKSLITPTQALAVLKGREDAIELVEPLIVKPDIKPLISTGPNDKRKTWEGKPPEQMFPDSEGEGQ